MSVIFEMVVVVGRVMTAVSCSMVLDDHDSGSFGCTEHGDGRYDLCVIDKPSIQTRTVPDPDLQPQRKPRPTGSFSPSHLVVGAPLRR